MPSSDVESSRGECCVHRIRVQIKLDCVVRARSVRFVKLSKWICWCSFGQQFRTQNTVGFLCGHEFLVSMWTIFLHLLLPSFFLFVLFSSDVRGIEKTKKQNVLIRNNKICIFFSDRSRVESKTKHMSRQLVQCFLSVSNLSQPAECIVPSFRSGHKVFFFRFAVNCDSGSLLINLVKYLRYVNKYKHISCRLAIAFQIGKNDIIASTHVYCTCTRIH